MIFRISIGYTIVAQSPKGRLIQGLHKPIHDNCAIYFYPAVICRVPTVGFPGAFQPGMNLFTGVPFLTHQLGSEAQIFSCGFADFLQSLQTHRIHGTNGIFTYLKTIKINESCR